MLGIIQATPSMAADAIGLSSQVQIQLGLTVQSRGDSASANPELWSRVAPCIVKVSDTDRGHQCQVQQCMFCKVCRWACSALRYAVRSNDSLLEHCCTARTSLLVAMHRSIIKI